MTADAVGGVWQYSVDLANELAGRGREVMLAVLGPPPSAEQKVQLNPSIHLAGGDFALEWMDNAWHDVDCSQEWLLAMEREFQPSIIHLNGYALASAPWQAPVVSVAHSCVYSWWHAVHSCSPDAGWREYERRVSRGLQSAAAVAAPSQFMADEIVRHYGVSRGKTSVIPNFSLASIPSPAVKEPFILAAGRMWDQAKNLSLLESIADQVDWPLHIAGSDKPKGATDLSSPRYLGKLTHQTLLDRMAAASIFVHPALYEPFGLAVLEAAKAKCCLVLADIPSLRELWDGAALFVDPHEGQQWIRQLNKLIGDPSERDRLAARAFSHSARYDAKLSVSLYLDIYDRCLRSNRAGNGAAA